MCCCGCCCGVLLVSCHVLCLVLCCGVCARGVVWCDTLKITCVRPKRPHVNRPYARMLKHIRAWCQYTRGRFGRTHGDVLEGYTMGSGEKGSSSILLTKICPRRVMCFRGTSLLFGLRMGREQHVPDSSDHSLFLMKLFSSSFFLRC